MPCRAFAVALVVCALGGTAPARAQDASEPNGLPVRSTSHWGLELISEGCRKSGSFRRLVEGLRHTTLIVYVEPVRELSGLMRGATSFLGLSGAYRYVRVSVGTAASRKQQISLIAHELQHATEIAAAAEVVDDSSLASFYRRIGDENRDGFDTGAARDTGVRVWNELWDPAEAAPEPAPAVDRRPTLSSRCPAGTRPADRPSAKAKVE